MKAEVRSEENEVKEEKRVGVRRSWDDGDIPTSVVMIEANRWLKTVQVIRGTGRVCRKGLYKFETFGDADRWMETMILSSGIAHQDEGGDTAEGYPG